MECTPTLSDHPSLIQARIQIWDISLSMLDTLDIMTRTLRLAGQSMLETSRMQSYKSRSLQVPTIVSRKGKQEQKEAYRDGGRRKRNGFPSRAQ
jgi:hypothetical protein